MNRDPIYHFSHRVVLSASGAVAAGTLAQLTWVAFPFQVPAGRLFKIKGFNISTRFTPTSGTGFSTSNVDFFGTIVVQSNSGSVNNGLQWQPNNTSSVPAGFSIPLESDLLGIEFTRDSLQRKSWFDCWLTGTLIFTVNVIPPAMVANDQIAVTMDGLFVLTQQS